MASLSYLEPVIVYMMSQNTFKSRPKVCLACFVFRAPREHSMYALLILKESKSFKVFSEIA